MAGVQVIWFSVPVACIYANVTKLQHFFTISCQYAHVFCTLQWSVHVEHYKSTDKLNLIGSLNVWRPCKSFTFHCIYANVTTLQHFLSIYCHSNYVPVYTVYCNMLVEIRLHEPLHMYLAFLGCNLDEIFGNTKYCPLAIIRSLLRE